MKIYTILLILCAQSTLNAQVFKLVHDFNPNGGSYTYKVIKFGNSFFTVTNDSIIGTELWISNLTNNTTNLVKDINIGSQSSDPYILGTINSKLLFFALDSTGERNLWASDGTQNGTNKISNIKQFSFKPTDFCIADSLIFFVANDNIHGNELWVTDGTSLGTHITKDIYPGIDSSINYYFSISNINNKVVFSANDGIHNIELWVSDGNDIGTFMLLDMDTNNNYLSNIAYMITLNNTVYYYYYAPILNNSGICTTDGTTLGTKMIHNIINCSDLKVFKNNILIQTVSMIINPQPITYLNSLSMLDTNIVGVIPFYSFQGNYLTLYELFGDSTFYFSTSIGAWLGSNGTNLGTYTLLSDWLYSWNRIVFKNKLYFGKYFDSSYGLELYSLDALNNNIEIYDIYNGPENSSPHHLTEIAGKLFFIARDSLKGYQLFVKKDNNSQVQVILPNQNSNNDALESFSAGSLLTIDSTIFVNANYDSVGRELYYLNVNIPLEQNQYEKKETNVSIYPNPSNSGIFYLKSSELLSNIEVFDTFSKKIISTINHKLDLSAFPSGFYFVKCTFKDNSTYLKIIKN